MWLPYRAKKCKQAYSGQVTYNLNLKHKAKQTVGSQPETKTKHKKITKRDNYLESESGKASHSQPCQ